MNRKCSLFILKSKILSLSLPLTNWLFLLCYVTPRWPKVVMIYIFVPLSWRSLYILWMKVLLCSPLMMFKHKRTKGKRNLHNRHLSVFVVVESITTIWKIICHLLWALYFPIDSFLLWLLALQIIRFNAFLSLQTYEVT